MKVLSIGSDQSLFDKDSPIRKRIVEYGILAKELHIIVFFLKKRNFQFPIFNLKGIAEFIPLRREASASGRSRGADFQLNSKFQISNNIFLYPTNSKSKWFYVWDAYKIAKKILVVNGQWLTTSQDPFEAGLTGWLIKKKFKIPLQLQIHTDFLSPYFWKESFLNKIRVLLAKFLIPRADCLRVVSKRIKDSLKANICKLKAEPTVLPIFVDTKKIQKTPITVNLHKKYPQFYFIILMASRLTKEKNIGLAILAMAEVVKKYSKTGLIIVGDGPEREALKFQVSNFKFQENIIFEKTVPFETLISYYKTADLFLLTSNYEGYGMSVIEAMAAGCPVIMTDVGLAGEVLIDKENGLVITVGDKEKLKKAILNLMENKELRLNLAANAKKIVDFWPSKNEYLKKYYNFWAKCLESIN